MLFCAINTYKYDKQGLLATYRFRMMSAVRVLNLASKISTTMFSNVNHQRVFSHSVSKMSWTTKHLLNHGNAHTRQSAWEIAFKVSQIALAEKNIFRMYWCGTASNLDLIKFINVGLKCCYHYTGKDTLLQIQCTLEIKTSAYTTLVTK